MKQFSLYAIRRVTIHKILTDKIHGFEKNMLKKPIYYKQTST